ncbi:MAG: helix-turn-helix transcriptional regulator [Kiritimatiellae bacterium]|nr:helix-turn-helix transcriptional regulator [Kiritimatiellia bacterium]
MKSNLVDSAGWLAALRAPQARIVVKPCHYWNLPVDWHSGVRTAPHHFMYLVTDSETRTTVRATPAMLRTGCFLWVSAGVPHQFDVVSGFPPPELLILQFALLRGEAGVGLADEFVLLWNAWELRPEMERIVDEWRTAAPPDPAAIRAALVALSETVFRLRATVTRGSAGPCFNIEQRNRLNAYVREHAASRPRPADLAGLMRLSEDYFTRVFRRSFGMTPRAWLMHERIRLAAIELAKTNRSISEVAFKYGYRDACLFSRQFKQVIGESPSRYRKIR